MHEETDLEHTKRKKTRLSERRLTEEESYELIMNILKRAGKPLTTRDVEGEIRKTLTSCPDTLPVLLNRLRMKGLVKGRLSAEHRGWIWWIETGS
jgi:predicted transcriptional regulator